MGGRTPFRLFLLRVLQIVKCILIILSLLLSSKYYKIILLQTLLLNQRRQTALRQVLSSNNVLNILFGINFSKTKNNLLGQLNCCFISSFILQKSSDNIKRNITLSFSVSYFREIMYKDVKFGAKKVKIFNRKNKKEIIFNLFIQTLICSNSSIYL